MFGEHANAQPDVQGGDADLVEWSNAANPVVPLHARVAPLDAATFAVIPVLLLLVAAVSVMIPAGRASKVDPVEALRQE